MTALLPELANLSVVFAPLFSKSVWEAAQVLLTGAILAVGPRTIAAALRVLGRSEDSQFQRFHRVLNRASWSSLLAARQLLRLLIATFAPQGPLLMVLDDTIERRRGERIGAKGIYRDPVRSSRSHFVKTSGLRWLCLCLLAPIPWVGSTWALPFCTVLAPSERYYQQRGRTPVKLTDRARQLLLMVKRWLPHRQIVVVADSSFAVLNLLHRVRHQVCMITRLRLDAALYAPVPPRAVPTRGRPRRKGERLPSLQALLDAPTTGWQRVTLSAWYGNTQRQVDLVSGTAVWYRSGCPIVPIRWVLVRDPQGQFEPQALLCTEQDIDPQQILTWFIRRWQIEVTFEEVRAHLGMETQRQWSDRAIARTTPVILALYSIVTWCAHRLQEQGALLVREAAWYRKHAPTFSDALAAVRRQLWQVYDFSTSEKSPDTVQIPRTLFARLTETLSYAA
jgi:hypothetical protein